MSGRQSKARRRRALAAVPAARARLRAAEPHPLLATPPTGETKPLNESRRGSEWLDVPPPVVVAVPMDAERGPEWTGAARQRRLLEDEPR